LPEAVVASAVADVLRQGAAVLLAAGCGSARLDAELLLASVLGEERTELVLDAERQLDREASSRFEGLIARRAAREPLAYILGRKDFRRITLAVDRRVLIPRPETELLAEVGLSLPRGARVIDVGTGSGAVALALKDERPDLEVWATDLDSDALALARENAQRLGLEARFARADLLEEVDSNFDAVLANLPYVADGEELPPEIARYEPLSALRAGPDGLDVIRRLVAMVQAIPLVALEIGFDQAEAVADLLRCARFRSIEKRRDLAGHERVVVAQR
jgi:release factor glutamine methyltransferase